MDAHASRLNRWFDRVPGLTSTIFGRSRSTWSITAAIGAVVGLATFVLLARGEGLSLRTIVPAAAIDGLVMFAFWRMGTRRARRRGFVLLEVALTAAAACGGVLAFLGAPLARAFDAWTIAAALGFAIGRVGCLAAGCCHGRPGRHGMRYAWAVPWRNSDLKLDGLRLVPLQGFEALLLLVLAGVGLAVMPAAPAGTAAQTIGAAYAASRFVLEMFRGDRRRIIGPFSHNQWTCLALLAAVAVFGRPSIAAAFAIPIALSIVVGHRRLRPPPVHVCSASEMKQLATAVDAAMRSPGEWAALGAARLKIEEAVTLELAGGLDAGTRAVIGHVAAVRRSAVERHGT